MQMRDQNPLVELFRHNTWATLRLLDACATLDDAQLDATVAGTMGSIRDILTHIAGAEGRYVGIFTSRRPPQLLEEAGFPGIAALRELIQASGAALQAQAATRHAPELLTVQRRGETQQLPAGIVLIQAINHATEHRAQVATILTQQGITPPEMDGWTFMAAPEDHA